MSLSVLWRFLQEVGVKRVAGFVKMVSLLSLVGAGIGAYTGAQKWRRCDTHSTTEHAVLGSLIGSACGFVASIPIAGIRAFVP